MGVDRYANRTELFAQRERGHRGSERHGPEAEQGHSDLAGGLMRDITAQESGTLSALVTVRTRHGRRGGGGRT